MHPLIIMHVCIIIITLIMYIYNMLDIKTLYYVFMQNKDDKTLYLRQVLGRTIAEIRNKKNISGNKLTNEYDLGNGNLSRIENAVTDCKFITLWRISEALGIKLSDLVIEIEKKLGDNFKFMDE